jgi:hypothetical protein
MNLDGIVGLALGGFLLPVAGPGCSFLCFGFSVPGNRTTPRQAPKTVTAFQRKALCSSSVRAAVRLRGFTMSDSGLSRIWRTIWKRSQRPHGTSGMAGTLYRFRLDRDHRPYPDPASRFQPQGPHGPSEVIDPTRFEWSDSDWNGVGVKGQVLYEVHIGTFTPEGTLPRVGRIGCNWCNRS